MFHLPAPPHTRVTRQVECVSCKEVFTIAEDDFRATGQPTHSWQMPPDQNSTTTLRYHPERHQRVVTSEPRAAPSVNPEDYAPWNGRSFAHLNCPRCGADNRNWLWLQEPPETTGQNPQQRHFDRHVDVIFFGMVLFLSMTIILAAISSLTMGFIEPIILYTFIGVGITFLAILIVRYPRHILPGGYRRWRQQFPLAEKSFLLTLGFALAAVGLGIAGDVPAGKIVILLVFMLFTAAMTAQKMTQSWREYRENQFLRQVAPATPNQKIHLALWGAFLILFSAFIVPLFFFRIAPLAFAYVSEKTAVNSENKPVMVAANATMARLPDNINAMPAEIRQAVNALHAFEEQGAALSSITAPQFLVIVETAHNVGRISEQTAAELEQYALNHAQQLDQMEEDTSAWLTQNGRKTIREGYKDLVADTRFMVLWAIGVGLTCVVTMMLSIDALNNYVAGLNVRLPPPLFTSIANMTRVVAWEMKRSLEIDYNLNQIEWTKATRNADGGVTLFGVQWDPAMYDDDGRARQTLAYTRTYQVTTDCWGRVHDVEVEVARVRVPPIRPGERQIGTAVASGDMAAEFFRIISAQPVTENPEASA
jgi:hypothetical protein